MFRLCLGIVGLIANLLQWSHCLICQLTHLYIAVITSFNIAFHSYPSPSNIHAFIFLSRRV